MAIIYLPYQQIDKSKWDACIKNASNKLIYAESQYLDIMAENWDALVLDDYVAVMPLIWRKKWGIKYLYQPAFFQQGGIYSVNSINIDTIESFLLAATKHFKFAEITLNHSNQLKESNLFSKQQYRNNYILSLKDTYENIYQKIGASVKRKINDSIRNTLVYEHSDDFNEAVNLYKQLYQKRLPAFSDKDFDNFRKLCEAYSKQKRIVIRKVFNKENMKLLAISLFLRDDKRIYNIMPCILPEGKNLSAGYFLLNELIKEFCGNNLLLDFEGSDIKGIEEFYRKWTLENQQYPFIQYNNLPLFIKWLKK